MLGDLMLKILLHCMDIWEGNKAVWFNAMRNWNQPFALGSGRIYSELQPHGYLQGALRFQGLEKISSELISFSLINWLIQYIHGAFHMSVALGRQLSQETFPDSALHPSLDLFSNHMFLQLLILFWLLLIIKDYPGGYFIR